MKRLVNDKRRFIICFFLMIMLFQTVLKSQQVISGTSDVKKFQMKPSYERGLPPKLFADLQFSDANGNGILEAEENAELKLTIINKGKGVAQDLRIKVTDELTYDKDFKIGEGTF